MRAALDLGAQMVNDVTALAEPDAVRLLATRSEPVVIMFSRNDTARASAAERSTVGVVEEARDLLWSAHGNAPGGGHRTRASRFSTLAWASSSAAIRDRAFRS